jgi:hypothetical protein
MKAKREEQIKHTDTVKDLFEGKGAVPSFLELEIFSGRSLVQRSPTDCGVRLSVIK